MAKAPVSKTGGCKPLQVRVLSPPQRNKLQSNLNVAGTLNVKFYEVKLTFLRPAHVLLRLYLTKHKR